MFCFVLSCFSFPVSRVQVWLVHFFLYLRMRNRPDCEFGMNVIKLERKKEERKKKERKKRKKERKKEGIDGERERDAKQLQQQSGASSSDLNGFIHGAFSVSKVGSFFGVLP